MAGPTTDSSGQIQKPGSNGKGGLADLIAKQMPAIAAVLPKHVSPDRMARVAMTALRVTPKLTECTPVSFLACLMQLSAIGLEPNTALGLAYLIPRKNKGQMECTTIIGYQGMLELARRSGAVTSVYAYAVRDGDRFSYRLGLDPTIDHVPSDAADRETKPITHTYAVARVKDADPIFVVLSRPQIEARRKRGFGGGPWDTDYEAMACKSAIRALWRYMPKSAEMQRAEDMDGAPVGNAIDESTAVALAKLGHAPPPPEDAIDAPGESVDPETGEVTPAPITRSPLEAEPD